MWGVGERNHHCQQSSPRVSLRMAHPDVCTKKLCSNFFPSTWVRVLVGKQNVIAKWFINWGLFLNDILKELWVTFVRVKFSEWNKGSVSFSSYHHWHHQIKQVWCPKLLDWKSHYRIKCSPENETPNPWRPRAMRGKAWDYGASKWRSFL